MIENIIKFFDDNYNKKSKVENYIIKNINNITKEQLNQVNEYNWTLLHYACHYFPKIAEKLIKKGLDPNKKNDDGFTPFHYASIYQVKIVPLLLKYKGDPNIENNFGWTPFDYLIINKKTEYYVLIQIYGGKTHKYDIPEEYSLKSFNRQRKVLQKYMPGIYYQLIFETLYDIPVGHEYYIKN